MRKLLTILVAAIGAVIAMPATAQPDLSCGNAPLTGKRVALLIGNNDYNDFEWPSLANASKDIDLVCDAFANAGIASRVVRNADREALTAALKQFATEVVTAESVIIYYAGHGFEYGGRNWLVPMDAPPVARRSEIDARYVSLETLVAQVVPKGAFTLIFMDACRTADPVVRLSDYDAADGAGSTSPMGLLTIDQGAVFYSTAKGRPALDQAPIGSPVSPFAASVVRKLGVPGLEIGDYFKVVSQDVYRTTRDLKLGPQQPFHYGSWFEDYYLVPPLVLREAQAMTTLAFGGPPAPAPAPAPGSGPAPAPTRSGPSDGFVNSALAGITIERLAIEDEPLLIAEVLETVPAAQLLARADRGDAAAQHLVGYMLAMGVGLRKDAAMARDYLERSATANYPPGQLELAWLLLEGSPSSADVERAQMLFEAAAASGYSKAKTHLAYRLATGIFGKVDYDRAEKLYVEAAAAGHPAAMFALTQFTAHRDRNVARLRTLADSGNAEGNHWLCEAAFLAGTLAGATDDCTTAAYAGYSGSRALLAHAIDKFGGADRRSDAVHWARLARSQADLHDDHRERIKSIPN